jgi:hypothetical protein
MVADIRWFKSPTEIEKEKKMIKKLFTKKNSPDSTKSIKSLCHLQIA